MVPHVIKFIDQFHGFKRRVINGVAGVASTALIIQNASLIDQHKICMQRFNIATETPDLDSAGQAVEEVE